MILRRRPNVAAAIPTTQFQSHNDNRDQDNDMEPTTITTTTTTTSKHSFLVSSTGTTTTRRRVLHQFLAVTLGTTATTISMATTTRSGPHSMVAYAADSGSSGGSKSFAPGGTLVDYEVGVTVGNSEASPTRQSDNGNVLFDKDYYFKFGTAPPWIEQGSVEFPKTMPFTPSQQRYDALKKYRPRIEVALYTVIQTNLAQAIQDGSYTSLAATVASTPEYAIRPLGLLANAFLASENTGTTNELYLARWYINEIYLHINDVTQAPNQKAAIRSYQCAIKAINSYLGMLNRVITPKVGDKFELLTPKV
jgi:hypothetical protein